jgi:hypothetical protein
VGYRDVEEREMVRETEIDALVRYASPNDIEIAYLFFLYLVETEIIEEKTMATLKNKQT